MTIVISLIVLCVGLQAAPPQPSPLLGHWVTTVKPGAGEAPMISPTLRIETRGDDLMVLFDGEEEPRLATRFVVSKSEWILMVRIPATSAGSRTIILRPTERDRLRYELFNEYGPGDRRKSFYYSEIFTRKSPKSGYRNPLQ